MGRMFERAKRYVDQLDPDYVGQFIEIGTSRNVDDGSTPAIAAWASEHGRTLWTIDMDINNCEFVKSLNIPNVEIINDFGEEWLRTFPYHMTTISVLYLDNFDWNWHPERTEDFVLEQQQRYRELGMEMNNVNSQAAHLAQMVIAMPVMAKQSVVICDDTWYNKHWGHYSGKSGAVVPYLISQGYRVAETEEHPVYGTILTRGI
jgi:hypothetical protein